MKKQVVVLGCGAWASAVARLISENIENSDEFNEKTYLYVYNEKFEGEPLADVINNTHVNSVYLPGFKLPLNVAASSNLLELVSTADILALVYPTRFVSWLVSRMKGSVKENAYFISFCKGLVIDPDTKSLSCVSDLIRTELKRECVSVVGATTAMEVAWKNYTECTIGSDDRSRADEVKRLLQTSYFRLTIVRDQLGVELCGALKHVVAIAAGIADGLQVGDNTKAAILRLGYWEMGKLMEELFPGRGTQMVTLEQSCGMAELFVCMSHRSEGLPAMGSDMDLMNILLGRSLTQERRHSMDSLAPLTNTRALYVNGAEYAEAINAILTERDRAAQYPLFTAVHRICQQKLSARRLIDSLRNHPVHQQHSTIQSTA